MKIFTIHIGNTKIHYSAANTRALVCWNTYQNIKSSIVSYSMNVLQKIPLRFPQSSSISYSYSNDFKISFSCCLELLLFCFPIFITFLLHINFAGDHISCFDIRTTFFQTKKFKNINEFHFLLKEWSIITSKLPH